VAFQRVSGEVVKGNSRRDKENETVSFEEHTEFFRWRCDHCNLAEEFDPTDFQRCWAELKGRGWRAHLDERDGTWEHKCPECKKNERSAEEILKTPFNKQRRRQEDWEEALDAWRKKLRKKEAVG
jgi:hypothetical protein